MKRCFALLSYFLLAKTIAFAQLVNNGATITVTSGATIKCTGNITNTGTIQNAGIVSSDGELRNESGGSLANNGTAGVYEATSKFINNGSAFSGIKLRLIGNANTDSIKSGAGSTFDSLIIAKGAGATATLSDVMTVNGGIVFNNDNNQLILVDKNLTLGASAVFQGADNNQFVITNSTGTVTKTNLGSTAFVYPVGFSATEFNPLTISNSGTVDNISVRCLQNILANGLTGSSVTAGFANNAWVLGEGTPGGSNLTLTGQWTTSDEMSNFNRLKAGVARYNTGTDWDLPASNVLASSGSGPYNRTRSGITSLGVFAVADLTKVNAAKLNLKIFLQGAGITNSSGIYLMNDLLRDDPNTGPIDPVIPTTQPYSSSINARFTRIGVYDGSTSVNETVSPSVFNVSGNDAIVDWVYISILDPSTPSTKLQTRAALLQRDGDIVDLDGVSPVSMPIDNDGNYHILVGHRNHLSIRTASAKGLADNNVFSFNFSTSLSQVYQDGSISNPPMKDFGGGFCLWGGNASGNNVVRFSTPGNDPGTILASLGGSPTGASLNVYSINDVNMDRKVRYSTPGNDPSFILAQVLGTIPTAIITEHL